MRARGAPLQAEVAGITAIFADGQIRIAEGWPDAKQLNGAVAVRVGDVFISGEGEIGGVAAHDISVQIGGAEESVFAPKRAILPRPVGGVFGGGASIAAGAGGN